MVRYSRDGDQFHYTWAARRCLLLIDPAGSLKAVTIEGASPFEGEASTRVTSGEELIDVAEYYGSEDLKCATQVRYIQVKHSTVRTNQPFTPSELEKTLRGWAKRYKDLQQYLKPEELVKKIKFEFVSNRSINVKFIEAVKEASQGVTGEQHTDIQKLERFTGLRGSSLAVFCKLLRLEGIHDGLWDQQNRLTQEVSQYLPDYDVDAPVQLKGLVTNKALSVSDGNPTITKIDVYRALKTDESRLFPAPRLIKEAENLVSRKQEREILEAIENSNGVPIIVHASGGVGKSVLALRIGYNLTRGSKSVLYDCYGDGQYRNASNLRHRHKDGLVQIANELAAQGLCHPLIPSSHADQSDYMRVFLFRLKQSISSLRSQTPQALLCIIIDAADNAQMAAEEFGGGRSFVKDLIKEKIPDGVCIVALCRTHRLNYLDPPPDSIRLELASFTEDETKAHLKQVFPDATILDVKEFHHLTSQNPRVQALALSQRRSLRELLRTLGPNPVKVDDMIGTLLDNAIKTLRYETGPVEQEQIDLICAGLAVLRPLIPLSILALMAGVDESAIRSFAMDLKRSLHVTNSTIQFQDEPSETWFRERFKPKVDELENFLRNLKPLTENSAYAASVLPQLMLEAGQLNELIELALSSEALPIINPIEKRDVELQRLQFAIKACLRRRRYVDAAKLALKAGGESASNNRQNRLLQKNTDLAAVFLEENSIQELVSRRTFGSSWLGSHHAYEASLLSWNNKFMGDASSRLRMAGEWLENWCTLSNEERQREPISDTDILELSIAVFNIYGADSCAKYLRSWLPREISFQIGRLIVSRFIDHGRYQELDKLAIAAKNDIYLIAAITLELREIKKTPPPTAIERAFSLIIKPHVKLEERISFNSEGKILLAMTALVEAAYRHSIGTTDEHIEILTRYLPESPPPSLSDPYMIFRKAYLRAFTLRAAFRGNKTQLTDIASEKIRQEILDGQQYSISQATNEFKKNIGTILPWYNLWASTVVNGVSSINFSETIDETKSRSQKVKGYYSQEARIFCDEIALIWLDILTVQEACDTVSIKLLTQWMDSLEYPLFVPTLTLLLRLSARSQDLKELSLALVNKAYDMVKNEREDAELKADNYVNLTRVVMCIDQCEANFYFNKSLKATGKVGDEINNRWEALLDLADRAASQTASTQEIAYRMSRCAEITREYIGDDKHFDWTGTIEAITGLCGKSSFSILSRWRDREFGWMSELLPITVNHLLLHDSLEPKIALPLICFRAQWNQPQILRYALISSDNMDERQFAIEYTFRYMSLIAQDENQFDKLKAVLTEFYLTHNDIDEYITFVENERHLKQKKIKNPTLSQPQRSKTNDQQDWDAIFNGIDLTVADDMLIAYRRLTDIKSPYSQKHFFNEACHRVIIGQEARFISVIANVTCFNFHDFQDFLAQIPEEWKYRQAIKSAVSGAIKKFCRRFCMTFPRGRYYDTTSFSEVCNWANIKESELLEVILIAISESDVNANARRLFRLVSLLTPKLTKAEALEALSFGLDLFDANLDDTDGDGPWNDSLAPPDTIENSIAGYIWSCLAAPAASLRWEAAHVVKALCAFKQKDVLNRLVELADGAPAHAFHDSRLHFYELHARQWLLIGLARAAKEYPDVIAPYSDFLIKLALNDEPHVLIRHFAKRTLLDLHDAGFLSTQPELRSKLTTVNKSCFPAVKFEHEHNVEGIRTHKNESRWSEMIGKNEHFYFGIDMGPYWFKPLGECFSRHQGYITNEVLNIIKNRWPIFIGDNIEIDKRRQRNIFQSDEAHHSHGIYPRIDDLRFYLSYHAMMITAGKLLSTFPLRHDPEYSIYDFDNWLNRHDPTRSDGFWLADRRDPSPLERPPWKNESEADVWRWSLTRGDFDRVLFNENGRLNLWGHWKWISNSREEDIQISSALVCSDRSKALLRALQCVDNPMCYVIPDVTNDLQIDYKGFILKGLIIDYPSERNLDIYDPWAGAIKYPPPRPASYIIDLMELKCDSEQRRWFIEDDHGDVAWAQLWGSLHENGTRGINHEHGIRFQASFEFITSLLQKIKMDLIIEVVIERTSPYYSERRNTNDNIDNIPPSARLFLIKSDGSILTM